MVLQGETILVWNRKLYSPLWTLEDLFCSRKLNVFSKVNLVSGAFVESPCFCVCVSTSACFVCYVNSPVMNFFFSASTSVFKVCHPRFHNFFFAADNVSDMSKWVQSSCLLSSSSFFLCFQAQGSVVIQVLPKKLSKHLKQIVSRKMPLHNTEVMTVNEALDCVVVWLHQFQ